MRRDEADAGNEYGASGPGFRRGGRGPCFDGTGRAPGPGEWHDTARHLKAENPHMTLAAIGRRLGVTGSAVWKALNPDAARAMARQSNRQRQPQKNAWMREYSRRPEVRGTCANPRCDNLRGQRAQQERPAEGERRRAGGRVYQRGYCQECTQTIAEVRRSLGEGVWADGWSAAEFREITGSIAAVVRSRGWDLPRRYAVKDGKRVAGEPRPSRNGSPLRAEPLSPEATRNPSDPA